MILLLILIISLVQLSFYYLIYRYQIKILNFIILVLMGYYFIVPQFFYPEPRRDGINCGMPILAITLLFWIFGTIGALGSHIIWGFIKKRKNAFRKCDSRIEKD